MREQDLFIHGLKVDLPRNQMKNKDIGLERLNKICARLDRLRESGKINNSMIARAIVDKCAREQKVSFSINGDRTWTCKDFLPILVWHAASLYQYVFNGEQPIIKKNPVEKIGYEGGNEQA